MWGRLFSFFVVVDSRFEDLRAATWPALVYRDVSAGLITALTAIPMSMAFAIASGLTPAQGIVTAVVSSLLGSLFGGSKYQVYGATAAFIPVLLAAMQRFGGERTAEAHAVLVLIALISGVLLIIMGLFGLGALFKKVPNSIIVGFTIGIGVYIAMTNVGDALGYTKKLEGGLFAKAAAIWQYRDQFNPTAFGLAAMTFVLTIGLLRLSIYVPGPAIAVALCTLLAATAFAPAGLPTVAGKYGPVTVDFRFTPPAVPELTAETLGLIAYFVAAVVFVSAVESLLCAAMADRLANNKGTPYDPNKEFWGQGLVQLACGLVNGFPATGALARTAISIKTGAVTPLAGVLLAVWTLVMALFLAFYLGLIPLASVGGLMIWVAVNMAKPKEIVGVWKEGWFHTFLMVFTAVMVPATDFLVGVLSALVVYALLYRFFTPSAAAPPPDATPTH